MRLKRNRLKQYSHRQAIPKKDSEGNLSIEYGTPSAFMAEVWPAGGKLQTELYGQRINQINNCRISGTYELRVNEKGRCYYHVEDITVCEGDGICLHVPDDHDPDYRIIAIWPSRFLTLEVERL